MIRTCGLFRVSGRSYTQPYAYNRLPVRSNPAHSYTELLWPMAKTSIKSTSSWMTQSIR